MDEKSQEYLNTILAKQPETLNQVEIAFLRARQSYLKKSQLEEYNDIFNPETKPLVTETVKKKNANPK